MDICLGKEQPYRPPLSRPVIKAVVINQSILAVARCVLVAVSRAYLYLPILIAFCDRGDTDSFLGDVSHCLSMPNRIINAPDGYYRLSISLNCFNFAMTTRKDLRGAFPHTEH